MTFPDFLFHGTRRYVPETLPILPADKTFYRVKHDKELGSLWRDNMPEVHPFLPNHFTPFTAGWQRLSFNLMPWIADKWTAVFSYQRAFTNNNGFGMEDDPRANFILGKDLAEDLPKIEALVCGGALLAGYVDGLNFVPETLNGRVNPPGVEWLKARPWLYFDAISVDGNGTPRRFPQGKGDRVLIPLIADRNRYPKITIPMWKLQRWVEPFPPDPYKIYL